MFKEVKHLFVQLGPSPLMLSRERRDSLDAVFFLNNNDNYCYYVYNF